MTSRRSSPTGSPERSRIHRLGPFDALGHRFAVRTDDPALAERLDELLRGLATRRAAGVTYRLCTPSTGRPGFRLLRDGEPLARTVSWGLVVDHLVWNVNRAVTDRLDGPLMLHAGAVALAGRGVVISGPSGAGKSTLTAGLVEDGLDYLSDEVAAVDTASGLVHPYAKPLGLRPPADELLPGLAPGPGSGERVGAGPGDGWLVPPPRPASGPVEPALIVLVDRVRGAALSAEPVSPARAVCRLATQTSHFRARPRVALAVLAGVARHAPTVALRHDDLPGAVAVVRRALERQRPA